MKEEWKDIEGHEGLYQISNRGNVKSLKRPWVKEDFLLAQAESHKGYAMVCLMGRGRRRSTKSVHRLVAKTFLPNSDHGLVVNHKDFDKKNNDIQNLEWCTAKENVLHSRRNDRKHPLAKLTRGQVQRIRLIKEMEPQLSQNKIAQEFQCSQSAVSRILHNKTWEHAT